LVISVGFVVIVTRKLLPEEFGLWGIILALITVISTPMDIWHFWMQRFHARKFKKALSTALTLNMSYFIIATFAYFALSYLYVRLLGWGWEFFLLGYIQLPVVIIYRFLYNVALIDKPELTGYASFIFDIFRLMLGYILVVIFKLKLHGAILTVILSLLLVSIFLWFMLKTSKIEYEFLGFDKGLAKTWFKGSYIPCIGIITRMLYNSDRLVVGGVVGEIPTAFLNAVYVSRSTIQAGAGAFTAGLYAKLLRERNPRDVEDILRLAFLIGLFMSSTFIILAKPILSFLNPVYMIASFLFIFVVCESFLNILITIFSTITVGCESIDIRPDVSFKDLIKSHLFKVPFARFIAYLAVLVSGIIILYYLKSNNIENPIIYAGVYVVLWTMISPILLIVMYRYAKSMLTFKLPWRDVIAYVIASLACIVYYVLNGVHNIVVAVFMKDAPILGFHVVIGGLIYLGISWLLSPWFRWFLRKGIEYVRAKASMLISS